MNFQSDYAKWIGKITEYFRQKYNRDIKTLSYSFELRYFSGYSERDVISELEYSVSDLHVPRNNSGSSMNKNPFA
ncbi:MAG TPA: hypothetical protein VE954_35885 [Oligoflexus sp.]|uniref:hypothetical protein n=1 Tax=Oligoflexus sp. TaxID=1971216 RepID=UPI002D4C63ED|nr:hypothetical protein [Oligoflexus sp.]HYX38514.1 hypothetical protein [Oligoflexus sp.]